MRQEFGRKAGADAAGVPRTRIEAAITIAAPPAAIFDFSQDYSKRTDWDPFLREATLLDCGSPGLGRRSWCVAWFGVGMESEYVSFQPPHAVAVKMTKGPWMFTQFAASWNFHAISDGRTEVRFVYSFQVRPIFLLAAGLIRAVFAWEMRRRLQALKRACETRIGPRT
jgi:hypothetical protein